MAPFKTQNTIFVLFKMAGLGSILVTLIVTYIATGNVIDAKRSLIIVTSTIWHLFQNRHARLSLLPT